MTTKDPHWDSPRTTADHGTSDIDVLAVEDLLAGNGLDRDDAEALRPVLLELRGLASDAPPVPSADLAALLELPDDEALKGVAWSKSDGGSTAPATLAMPTVAMPTVAAAEEGADATVIDFTARRMAGPGSSGWKARAWKPGRTALAAAAVVVSLGAAAGAAVAADGNFLEHTRENIVNIVGTLTNTRPVEPAPAPGSDSPVQPEIQAPHGSPSSPSPQSTATPAPGSGVPDRQSPALPGVPNPGHGTLPRLPDTPRGAVDPVLPSQLPTVVPSLPATDELKGGTAEDTAGPVKE